MAALDSDTRGVYRPATDPNDNIITDLVGEARLLAAGSFEVERPATDDESFDLLARGSARVLVRVQVEEQNLGDEARTLLATSQEIDLSRRAFDWLFIVTFDETFVVEEVWQLPFDAVCELTPPGTTTFSVTSELREDPRAELLQDARGAPAAKFRSGVHWQRDGCAPNDPDVTDLYASLLQDGSVSVPWEARDEVWNALKRRVAEDGYFTVFEIGTAKLIRPLQAEDVADPVPGLHAAAEELYFRLQDEGEVFTSVLFGSYHAFADLQIGRFVAEAIKALAQADGLELHRRNVDDVGEYLWLEPRS